MSEFGSFAAEPKVVRTVTKTVTGIGDKELTCAQLLQFLSEVPSLAKIKARSTEYVFDRPYGYTKPWELTATWQE